MSLTNAPVTIIGIDAATQDSKIGLARGVWDHGCARVDVLCDRQKQAANVIKDWLATSARPVLLTVDAPLGWPIALSRALRDHRAGDEVMTEPPEVKDGKAIWIDDMFRRATDRFIQKEFRKTPLDVGADRIARTARAALKLLGELRKGTGLPIPLVWSPMALPDISVIEVYPAATLLSHGYLSSGYKKPNDISKRGKIIQKLQLVLDLPKDVSLMETNADTLDAVVCILAGKDFLDDAALPPCDLPRAQREGWIWVKKP